MLKTKNKINKKELIKNHFDKLSVVRESWISKSSGFYSEDIKIMKEYVPEESRVLEVGCGTGHLLAALKPSVGVGIDISKGMIKEAKKRYSNIKFIEADIEDESSLNIIGETFDYIIISDTIGYLSDIETTLNYFHKFSNADTRFIVAYYSPFWEPILNIAAK